VIRLFQTLRPLPAPTARPNKSALMRLVQASSSAAEPAQDQAVGCGWFDSSHELRCGLMVQEHLATDSLAADLPLADWLALNLWSKPVTLAA
jgi:hypothetical protein